MLTRQWQFGELGEDAAGPAYVQISGTTGRVLGQRARKQSDVFRPGVPEPVIQGGLLSDLATRGK
jgi:hypothetical protein